MTRSLGRDDGSTMPLTIFFAALSLVLILLVAAITSLYLERKRLFTLADGAALVGAEAFGLEDVTVSGAEVRPALDSADVEAAVADYLANTPTGFDDLTLERADSADGLSATVELSAWWSPPVLSAFVPAGVRIEVTAVARSVFG